MRKFIVFLIIALIYKAPVIYSQTVVSEQELPMPSLVMSTRRAYVVTDELNGRFCLFLGDSKLFRCELYDEGFNIKETIVSKSQPSRFAFYHGSTIKDSIATIYFSNIKNNKFLVRKFDFRDNTSREIMLKIPKASEAFIASVQANNTIYLIYVVYRSSILKIYSLKDGIQAQVKEVDLSSFKYNERGDLLLFDVLNDPFIEGGFVRKIAEVDYDTYNTIEVSAVRNKVFVMEGDIYITLNYDPADTKVIRIDGQTLEGSITSYQTPMADCKNGRTNSFLYDNILYQLNVCNDALKLSGTEIGTGKLIKTYELTAADDSVWFSNVPLMQKGGRYVEDNKYQELEVKQFLRKLNHESIGVSVFRRGFYNEVLTGCYQQISNQSGTRLVYYNNDISTLGIGYYNNINSRSVYFKSIFHPVTMEHYNGPVEVNPFLQMDEYFEGKRYDEFSIVNFRYRDAYILGYYAPVSGKYFLIKF